MYHIKQLDNWSGINYLTIDDTWPHIQQTLMQLAHSFGSDTAKELIAGDIMMLDYENAELLKCIVKKDLKAGISAKTINAVFPGLVPTFDAMKAKKFEENRWDPSLLGSVKLDGLRCQSRYGELLSMNGQRLLGLAHIENLLKGAPSLDGELLVPGEHFQVSSGLLRSHKPVPNAVFCVFDAPGLEERVFKDRYAYLEEFASNAGWSNSVMKPTTITLVKHQTFKDLDTMYATFHKVLAAGFEGLMLKTPDHLYQPGSRTYDWMKVKNVLDEDVCIVGFYEGKGKYEGALGGVLVDRPNGVTSKVGGGFSDQERVDIWANQSVYKGKMIEVHYHEETPDGDYRHARFKRFRPDKEVA